MIEMCRYFYWSNAIHQYIGELVLVLECLHEMDIMYRDLKVFMPEKKRSGAFEAANTNT